MLAAERKSDLKKASLGLVGTQSCFEPYAKSTTYQSERV